MNKPLLCKNTGNGLFVFHNKVKSNVFFLIIKAFYNLAGGENNERHY
ncbi:hypothetical protein LBKG_00103 [Lactobacillus crispatus CTV-05]|jgi:hypothetical protein|nr:hypothetical protein HMPREF0506_1202 [Lactobacillus crispatus JV-V01]EFQ45149.1 hypothetical protein LBKG_00103 [Lactobacillus crispatus CTV-05]MBI1702293.1 hypothetical protein [Lactobacillus crispatus]